MTCVRLKCDRLSAVLSVFDPITIGISRFGVNE